MERNARLQQSQAAVAECLEQPTPQNCSAQIKLSTVRLRLDGRGGYHVEQQGRGLGKINMLTVNWDCCYFLSHFDFQVG